MRENKKPNPPKAEDPATKEPEQSPSLHLAAAPDLEEAEKAVDIAATELGRLCDARWKGGEAWERAWHWEIPANEERDTDLKIGKAISICKDLIAEVRRLRALHSPAAPSGVVDVLGIEAIRASFVEDGKIDARVQALIDEISRLRASLPQAPATPAAAPVEVRYEHLAHDDEMWASDEVEYEPGKWEMVGAKWMGEKYKDGMKRVRRKVPAPGSQGVEAPRKQTGK